MILIVAGRWLQYDDKAQGWGMANLSLACQHPEGCIQVYVWRYLNKAPFHWQLGYTMPMHACLFLMPRPLMMKDDQSTCLLAIPATHSGATSTPTIKATSVNQRQTTLQESIWRVVTKKHLGQDHRQVQLFSGSSSILGAPPMFAAFAVVLVLSRHVSAGCVLPIRMEGFQPTAMVTLSDKLVITNSAGVLLFVDLDDFIHQHDLHVFREAPGANIQGLTVTNPQSTYLYLGAEHAAEVLEYEWHSSHKIFRKFQLLGLPGSNGHPGLQSLTFVPTPASSEEGYFYASTGTSGEFWVSSLLLLLLWYNILDYHDGMFRCCLWSHSVTWVLRVKLERGAIHIYEVPLLSEGTLESASSVSEWKPNPRKTASHHARGLAYADGYLLFGGYISSPHPFFTPLFGCWGFCEGRIAMFWAWIYVWYK